MTAPVTAGDRLALAKRRAAQILRLLQLYEDGEAGADSTLEDISQEAFAILEANEQSPPPHGYVWNCYTKSREGDGPLFVAHDDTVTARLDGYAIIPMEEHNAALDRIATLEAALHRITQWADAYPPSAFPPMTDDWAKRANAVLVDHGMTIDRISADAMRHVIEGVGKIAAAALADATGEKP